MDHDAILSLSGEQILRIKQPELLLGRMTPSADDLVQIVRRLNSKWHPDRGGSNEVFQHIRQLITEAESKISSSTWKYPGYLVVENDSNRWEIHYKKEDRLSGGHTRYETKTTSIYRLSKADQELFDLWRETPTRLLKKLQKDDHDIYDALEKPFKFQINAMLNPIVLSTKDDHYLAIKHEAGYINLADILSVQKVLDIKAVTWIITRLLSFNVFTEYLRLENCGFWTDSVFINPEKHSVIVKAGWQFCRGNGKPAAGASREVIEICPELAKTKIPTTQMAGKIIREIASIALGHPRGIGLTSNPSIPKPISKFLLSSSHKEAVLDLKHWEQARDDSFPREFVHCGIKFEDIYQEI